ncbi:MAG: glycosyltransferase [Desulfatitalea sp.]
MTPIPETSVVITCFNYGHYIKGCIESVLAQSYGDYEIVVVDDGSTDDTSAIMQGFAALPNLNYIRQQNGGQAKAKNRGVQSARGRYLAFLDADDMWEKDKLEKQLPLFSADTVGVVFSRARFIGENGQPLDYTLTGKYLVPRKGRVSEFIFLDNFVPFSSSIVRRQCFERCGGFDESFKMGIDWDLWLRLSVVYEFDFIDEPLMIYRMRHAGQMSQNAEERQRCSDRIMKQFQENFPDILSAETIRRAAYVTNCNRGEYYSDKRRMQAIRHFAKAIQVDPLNRHTYAKIAKLFFKSLLVGRRK